MSDARLEFTVEEAQHELQLCAPDVGLFTQALPRGAALAAGQPAGVLLRLGRASALVVPEGVHGIVISEMPLMRQTPVQSGAVLYRLAPLDSAALQKENDQTHDAGGDALTFRAPQSGRFYHRPAPGEEAFVSPGSVIEEGTPLGLLEVMKTFTHVTYRPKGSLPARAKVVRFVVQDGADVEAGAALLELESA